MTRPMRTWISGIVVLAMVGFAQLCAIQPQIMPATAPTDEHVAVEQTGPLAAEDHDDSACSPGECGGDSESCPGGASVCCSTWGLPARAGTLEPPVVVERFEPDLHLLSAELPLAHNHAAQPVEVVRPPGPTEAALLLISAVSRRGPPSLS
ncbi:MAG: hypothetical protein ABIS67_04640 [Candidatus Eisenbacteria bacterium]